MREYIEVVRLVMDTARQGDGSIEYDGRFYQIRARSFFGRSTPQPRPQVPIYLAAVKPRMAALTGEIADGLVGNPMFSPQHVADTIVPHLAAGLRTAGRQRSDIEVLGQCFAVVDNDLATAYRVGAGAMLFSIRALIYDDIFAAHGFAETVAQVRATQRSRQRLDAISLIPREMVDAFCAVGPLDRVRAKVNEREGLLDTVIVAVPNTGTTAEQRDHYRNKLLEAFSAWRLRCGPAGKACCGSTKKLEAFSAWRLRCGPVPSRRFASSRQRPRTGADGWRCSDSRSPAAPGPRPHSAQTPGAESNTTGGPGKSP